MSTSKNKEQNEKKSKKFKIYAHVNKINGKIYIGQTCKSPKQRWDNGKGYSYNGHFWNSIQKYGWDNFEHIILMEDLSKEMSNIIEIELIKKYRATDSRYGYNMKGGGDNGYETYNPNYVRTYSEETRLKMSRSQIARFDRVGRKVKVKPPSKQHPNIHKIYKLDSNFEVICEYTTKVELSKEIGKTPYLFYNTRPYCVYDNFIYVFADFYMERRNDKDFLDYVDRKLHNATTNTKKVICLNDLKVYYSISEASRERGVNFSGIISCCKGIDTYAGIDPELGKLMWEYYDENKKYEKQQYTDYRRCYCITTNRLFNSALDASSEYGIDAQHIYLACRKNKKHVRWYNKLSKIGMEVCRLKKERNKNVLPFYLR